MIVATFEIIVKTDPDANEGNYGTVEAESARTLIIDIVKDLGGYYIDQADQITVADVNEELPIVIAFSVGDDEWEFHEYDGVGNDVVFVETTEITDSFGDTVTIHKTDEKALYDGIECSLWIHDDGDMVTYYCQCPDGEFVDTTNNSRCDVKSDAYALVANVDGGVSKVFAVPFRGYLVNGMAFERLQDAMAEARGDWVASTAKGRR